MGDASKYSKLSFNLSFGPYASGLACFLLLLFFKKRFKEKLKDVFHLKQFSNYRQKLYSFHSRPGRELLFPLTEKQPKSLAHLKISEVMPCWGVPEKVSLLGGRVDLCLCHPVLHGLRRMEVHRELTALFGWEFLLAELYLLLKMQWDSLWELT